MNKIKKILNLSMLLIFVLSITACGNNDKTWALKSKENTVPNGVYLYFLFDSYNNAVDYLSQNGSTVENIAEQNIEGEKSIDWIQDQAISSAKNMMAVETLFDESNLSLTDEENNEANETAESFWEYSGERMEKYGISKDDYKRAYGLTSLKTQKLFNSIYGKDGTKSVSDDDLLNFYKGTYAKVSFLSKSLGEGSSEEDNTQQNNVNPQADAKIEDLFKGYVNSINSGEKTIESVSAQFQQLENIESNPLETEIINPNDEDLSDEIKDAITNLEIGKATCLNYNDSFILLYKNSMDNETIDLSDESIRNKILQDMKYSGFVSTINEKIDNMKIKVNYKSINDYNSVEIFKES